MGRRKKSENLTQSTDGSRHKQNSRFAQKPIQRNAANARERSRMRTLSKAFSRLKTTLPWVPADTKLSKLDTLRSALSYIQHLNRILQEDPGEVSKETILPARLTWPLSSAESASRRQILTDALARAHDVSHHHHDREQKVMPHFQQQPPAMR